MATNLTKRIEALEASRRTAPTDAQHRMARIMLGEEVDKLTLDERTTLAAVVFGESEKECFNHPLYIRVCEVVNTRLQEVAKEVDG